MIKNFQPRLYQQTILGTAARYNTLVVLPTGLGKTAIAFLLAAQRFNHYPNSKVLILAPTKPLCEQHWLTFKNHLDLPEESFTLFTGDVKPERRAELWKSGKVIISTPQGLQNDLINQRINLQEVSLLVFDEAHHATGDYAYVWLARQYAGLSKYSRILALTASPGSDLEQIKEICKNLQIEKVEVRTEKDPDVKDYLQKVKINWQKVAFPSQLKVIQQQLLNCKKSKLIEAKNLGYCNNLELTKGQLLLLQRDLQKKLNSGYRDFELLRSLSLIAEALKVDHAIELLETQGIKPLDSYFKKLQLEAVNSKTKAAKNLSLDANFKLAVHSTTALADSNLQHPKLIKLKQIMAESNGDSKTIIFTQFRDSAEQIIKVLSEIKITSHIFVGQTRKNGLGFSQKEQKQILDRFRQGEFRVLVATSVAEEGLDIPKVEEVIFYEPIPSAIRAIQRRGRTGRLQGGQVTVLVTEGTRDEIYRWVSHHKEKRMYSNLEKIKTDLVLEKPVTDNSLNRFIPKDQVVAILADHREKDNRIVKELIELGISVKTAQLNSADYILSEKVGVELKTITDFVNSIVDGRLLHQVKDLKTNFDKAILVVEGEEDIYTVRKVHANAIRGMLASITLDFKVPVLYTKNPKDTAALLAIMAKREQGQSQNFFYPEKKPLSIREQQEFIVSSLPMIGMVTARNLLKKFKSIRNLTNASREDLLQTPGVGEIMAQKLIGIFEKDYEDLNLKN